MQLNPRNLRTSRPHAPEANGDPTQGRTAEHCKNPDSASEKSTMELGILAWRKALELIRERTYASPITVLIVTLNLVIHFCLSVGGEDLVWEAWLWGGFTLDAVDNSEFWRFFTASWIHADWDHVLNNCMAIYVLGLALEPAILSGRFALLYIFATVFSSFTNIFYINDGISAGASDGAYALIGAMIAVPVCAKLRPAILLWGLAALYVTLDWIGDAEDPTINYGAHIAGFLVGIVGGTLAGPGATPRQWAEDVEPQIEPVVDAATSAGTIRPFARRPSRRLNGLRH